MKILLTPAEAAAQMNVPVPALLQLAKAGSVPGYVRINRTTHRFRADELAIAVPDNDIQLIDEPVFGPIGGELLIDPDLAAELRRGVPGDADDAVVTEALSYVRKYRRDGTRRIYFVRPFGLRVVKIGVANDVRERISTLQTAWPVPLRILLELRGGDRMEASLQSIFSRYHVRCEWFLLHQTLCRFIEQAVTFGLRSDPTLIHNGQQEAIIPEGLKCG